MEGLLSSSRPWWRYDVFVSFRGEDTRKNFTDHLCRALAEKGINIFKDDKELEIGKPISPELVKAIEESRFSIIVFSRNYATSSWCLDELVKIIECMKTKGQTVVPIFYDVNPTEVRKQTGSFQKAFDEHEKVFGAEKLEKWKAALTEVGNLSGWHLQDWHEAAFIQKIVKKIWTKLSHSFSTIAKGLVGIGSFLKEMNTCLGMGLHDVRFIGIYGMGGIGKTTIAKVIYNRYSHQFEGSSFISNVREVSEKFGLACLQEQLLSQTLMLKNVNILGVHRGIYKWMQNKRVFVVLDDIDKLQQLQTLAGDRDWFGPGSRIIITTRDEHLLIAHHVDIRYKANSLDAIEALQLFSLKAFNRNCPPEDYWDLCSDIVSYANGLPLALVVLGSYLCGRSMKEWTSALRKLKEIPKSEIFDVLKISYDGLEEMEKMIFLDAACLFNLKKVNRVIEILEACDFYPEIGLRVLIDKSLVAVDNTGNRLQVHNLLQEMAWAIVHQESPKEPGKRSRLWLYDDICHVLTKKRGTEAVEIIYRKSFESKAIYMDSDAFLGMNNLRLLKIHDVHLPKGLDFLPDELRILKWHGYPLKSLPSSFKAEKLVELDMSHSGIELLWKERVHLEKLKIIKLSHSRKLTRSPDFTIVPNLEKLILEGCTNLYRLHPSIGELERLIVLNLKDCENLRSLPRIVSGWRLLKVLLLLGCSRVEKLPENLGEFECLEELDAGKTAITVAPSSIATLKNLKKLSFRGCKGQTHKLQNWFSSLLPVGGSSFALPSLAGLLSLTNLDLSYCNLSEETIPSDLGHIATLRELNLSGNNFVKLPASINQLSQLLTLQLANCLKLQVLTELPSSIEKLRTYNCSSLRTLSGPSELHVSNYREFSLQNCFRLVQNQGDNDVALSLLKNHLFIVAKLRILEILLRFSNFIKSQQGNNKFNAELHSYIVWWFSILFKEFSIFPKTMPRLVVFVPADGIPDWFTCQATGNSITIPLPPNCCDDSTFLGLAVCATLGVKECHRQEERNNDQWPPGYWQYMEDNDEPFSSNSDYKCKFFLLSGDQKNCKIFGEKCYLNGDRLALSNHLWLFFIPYKVYFQRNWSYIQAYFRLEGSGLEFNRCGLRFVYLQDVELVQTMFQDLDAPQLEELSTQFSQFIQRAASCLTMEEKSQSQHVCHYHNDEAGPSGSGSSNDDQVGAGWIGPCGAPEEMTSQVYFDLHTIELKGKSIQD